MENRFCRYHQKIPHHSLALYLSVKDFALDLVFEAYSGCLGKDWIFEVDKPSPSLQHSLRTVLNLKYIQIYNKSMENPQGLYDHECQMILVFLELLILNHQ